jgi:hypothetical protein
MEIPYHANECMHSLGEEICTFHSLQLATNTVPLICLLNRHNTTPVDFSHCLCITDFLY